MTFLKFPAWRSITAMLSLALCLCMFNACSGDDDDEDDITLTADTSADDTSDDEETTSSDITYVNGYAAVDLGLSVKWATCNIGADSPEDYGNYYAWGETETKDEYTSSNSVTYGVEMSNISGKTKYDAATANWGDSWRMTTHDEMSELINSCTWRLKYENGVKGYLVTGSNGNSIFLPATGYRDGTSRYEAGSTGNYWSSTPVTSGRNKTAWYLFFSSSGLTGAGDTRYFGYTVRPVSDY